MGFFIPEGVDIKQPPKSQVNMTDRPWNNRVMCFLFGGLVLAQLIVSIVMMAGAADITACPGWDPAAVANHIHETFGETLKAYAGVFAGAMVLVVLGGLSWIFLLQKCATVITWGTLIAETLGCVALGVWLLTEDSSGPAITVFVFAGTMLLAMVFKKTAVNEAAEMLRQAAFCLAANPGLVFMSLCLQIVLMAIGAVTIGGLAASFLVGDYVVPPGFTTCVLQPASWPVNARYFVSLMLTWMMWTVLMLRAYMVGGTAGMWYWHSDQNIPNKACKALSWGATTGFGTVACAGLVVSIMDRLNRAAQSKMADCVNCCNPLWWVFRLLMCYLKEMINALSKFCLILAAVSGEDFFVSCGRTYYTLKGRFSTLFVVDGVAKVVLYSGAMIFSLVIAFFAWTTASHAIDDEDPFKGITAFMANTETSSLTYVFAVLIWILSGLLVYYPLFGVLFLTFLSEIVYKPTFGNGFAFGVFTAAICNYIFTFFANVILDVCSAMFVLVSIDRKNGQMPAGDSSIEGSPAAVGHYYLKLAGEPSVTSDTYTGSPPVAMTNVVTQPVPAQPKASAPLPSYS